MITTAALGFIIAAGLRQARRTRRALNALTADSDGCAVSWCGCGELGDPDCTSRVPFTGGHYCDQRAGHAGMHSGGGYRWTNGFGS